MDGCECVLVFGHFSFRFAVINPITGILWFCDDFITGSNHCLPAHGEEVNQLLLQMIWFSHSLYSVRYDHPLWPKILQKSCYSSPCDIEWLPPGVQKGIRLWMQEWSEKEGEREIIWADVVCWCVVYEDENGIDHLTLSSLTLYYYSDRGNGEREKRTRDFL